MLSVAATAESEQLSVQQLLHLNVELNHMAYSVWELVVHYFLVSLRNYCDEEVQKDDVAEDGLNNPKSHD